MTTDDSDRAFWISINRNDVTFELVHSGMSQNAIVDNIIVGQGEYDAKDYDDTYIYRFVCKGDNRRKINANIVIQKKHSVSPC